MVDPENMPAVDEEFLREILTRTSTIRDKPAEEQLLEVLGDDDFLLEWVVKQLHADVPKEDLTAEYRALKRHLEVELGESVSAGLFPRQLLRSVFNMPELQLAATLSEAATYGILSTGQVCPQTLQQATNPGRALAETERAIAGAARAMVAVYICEFLRDHNKDPLRVATDMRTTIVDMGRDLFQLASTSGVNFQEAMQEAQNRCVVEANIRASMAEAGVDPEQGPSVETRVISITELLDPTDAMVLVTDLASRLASDELDTAQGNEQWVDRLRSFVEERIDRIRESIGDPGLSVENAVSIINGAVRLLAKNLCGKVAELAAGLPGSCTEKEYMSAMLFLQSRISPLELRKLVDKYLSGFRENGKDSHEDADRWLNHCGDYLRQVVLVNTVRCELPESTLAAVLSHAVRVAAAMLEP